MLSQSMLKIPSNMASVSTNVTVCPSACTAKRLDQPITLIGGTLHMHGLGKSSILRKFRDNKELQPVDQLHAFDYNFHDFRPFIPQTLLPGDTLTLQCTFDSTGRTNMTTWGPGTLDEMCIYYLRYYPHRRAWATALHLANKLERSVTAVLHLSSFLCCTTKRVKQTF